MDGGGELFYPPPFLPPLLFLGVGLATRPDPSPLCRRRLCLQAAVTVGRGGEGKGARSEGRGKGRKLFLGGRRTHFVYASIRT